jgi:hypothetical protein
MVSQTAISVKSAEAMWVEQCWNGTTSIIIKQALQTVELALAPLSETVYIQVWKALCILLINAAIY